MSQSVTAITGNILLIANLALCQLAYAQSKTVEVTEGKPIAKAVQLLEAIYGVPITYEDTMVVNDSQLEDITEKVQRSPDPSHRITGPKPITLSFTYKLPSSGPSPAGLSQIKAENEAKVSDALVSVLDGYAAAGGSVTFSVTQEDGIFHVMATNFLNIEGKFQQMTPLLDTKISILPGQRTRGVLINEICQTLSKTAGVQVGIWDFPYNGSQSDTLTTISGSDVTARSLLSQLLAEMAAPISRDVSFLGPDGQRVPRNMVVWKGCPLSWGLFYSRDSGYMLSIHYVLVVSN
jgi:hypothetical protein